MAEQITTEESEVHEIELMTEDGHVVSGIAGDVTGEIVNEIDGEVSAEVVSQLVGDVNIQVSGEVSHTALAQAVVSSSSGGVQYITMQTDGSEETADGQQPSQGTRKIIILPQGKKIVDLESLRSMVTMAGGEGGEDQQVIITSDGSLAAAMGGQDGAHATALTAEDEPTTLELNAAEFAATKALMMSQVKSEPHEVVDGVEVEAAAAAAVTTPTEVTTNQLANAARIGLPLPEGKPLSAQEAMDTIMHGRMVYDSIPTGLKEDVFFLINNTRNLQRRNKGLKCQFSDDCGAWNSKKSSSPRGFYTLKGERLTALVQVNGRFCHCRAVNKQKIWEPLDPQPDQEDVIEICRNYVTLKASPGYKRRITWVVHYPEQYGELRPVALVEYTGKYPGLQRHGNSKKGEARAYVRTPAAVLEQISEEVLVKQPMLLFNDLTIDGVPEASPRDLKQIRNMKYHCKRKQRDDVNNAYTSYFADHMAKVMAICQTHPYVQQVIQRKKKAPIIILYNQKMFNCAKHMCWDSDTPSVLAVEGTFDLGRAYVTMTSFRLQSVVTAETGEHPVMYGPLMLHGTATFDVYHAFFSHLSSVLGGGVNDSLTIGCEDITGITRAIQSSLPEATNLLCTRHIESKVDGFLRQKTTVTDVERERILWFIFGEGGIVDTNEANVFTQRLDMLKAAYRQDYGEGDFIQYVDTELGPLLRSGVLEPSVKRGLNVRWTNETGSSTTDFLTAAADPEGLVGLIEKLASLLTREQRELEKAVYGEGDGLSLAPNYDCHHVTPDTWRLMSDTQRNQHLSNFWSNTRRSGTWQVVSDGGELKVMQQPQRRGRKRRLPPGEAGYIEVKMTSSVDG